MLIHIVVGKLIEKHDVVEVGMTTMKEKNEAMMIALQEETEGELVVCQPIIGKGLLSAALNREIDIPKSEKFKGERSTREVDTVGTKDCLKWFVFFSIKEDDEPKEMPIRLGVIVCGIEAKRGKEGKKKLVKCFLHYGLHRM
ncbi:hypothetical protein J1N35_040657 [Gossypium stocksii]|uniref:Uncharacterized protein n=1 Tax=Gossypium stocksii TaxID=47602 RepID=A0A9D3UE04_9ROSI|nr:hypothetical protein J1N35_040657 [Gossypium stocksii]